MEVLGSLSTRLTRAADESLRALGQHFNDGSRGTQRDCVPFGSACSDKGMLKPACKITARPSAVCLCQQKAHCVAADK